MDIEVIKSFDDLLDAPIMLAKENHVNFNPEAGCFGAEKGNVYIKKCMEYFHGRNFFAPRLLETVLALDQCERHDFVKPLILPEIMHNVLKESFADEPFTIYSRDYFTTKNILTGKIEKTKNTYTIHHFATLYHSQDWRSLREREQKVRSIFGEKSFASRVVLRLAAFVSHIKKNGLIESPAFNPEVQRPASPSRCG
jgi:hypothetical protein